MFANPPGFTAPHAPILLVPRATALVRSPSQGILALLCQLAWAASLSVGFVVSFQAVGGRGAGGGRGRLKQSEGAVPLGPFLPLPLALAKEPLILAAERRHEEANLLFASRHEARRHAMFVFQKDKQKGVETCSRKWLAQAAERAFSVGVPDFSIASPASTTNISSLPHPCLKPANPRSHPPEGLLSAKPNHSLARNKQIVVLPPLPGLRRTT